MFTTPKTSRILPILAAGILFVFTACDDDSTGPGEIESEIEVHTVTDLDTGYGGRTAPSDTTYFSLRNNSSVDAGNASTTQWDVAFTGTTILTNSGSSGPGEGGAIVLDQPFGETVTAPSTGYAVDTSATSLAIPTGSNNGWYNYNTSTHMITPIDNKTILIKTADGGHFAKINILSWYQGNPDLATDTPSQEDYGFYTFEYAIQMNGTTELN